LNRKGARSSSSSSFYRISPSLGRRDKEGR
jgi:hypothetical protein